MWVLLNALALKTWLEVFAEYVGPLEMYPVGQEAEGTCVGPQAPLSSEPRLVFCSSELGERLKLWGKK